MNILKIYVSVYVELITTIFESFKLAQTGPEVHPTSCTMCTECFPGVNRPRRGVCHPPHRAPRLKKELSYTSTPPLSLRGLF